MINLPPLYLASQSIRRRQLLQQIACPFTCLFFEIDESRQGVEAPIDYATRLAKAKAQTGWNHPDRTLLQPVLGADTIVVLKDQIFGKPRDKQDGLAMLRALSGTTHQVYTAIALCFEDEIQTAVSQSDVRFASLTENECLAYWETGEGADKAGCYGLQGLAALFISEIRGSYSGVMGLPLYELHQLIRPFIK